MPDISSQFFQYSSGIADASYAFDFNTIVTITATGTFTVVFPPAANILRGRTVTVTDVTAARGGTAPSKIACYFRIDGQTASAGAAADGSFSRPVIPGGTKSINRFIASESGITLFNPNATAVQIQVELGG